MAIVSSVVIEDAVQADGRRHVTEVHTDNVGLEHYVRYMAEAGADVNAAAAARATIIEERLAAAELAANEEEVVQ